MEEKKYVKALEVIEDCHIKSGHKIRLYGKETTVTGFHASYNDGIEKWETIILTEGRGDPFERSLDAIEVLPDQSDVPDHPRPVWVKASNPQIKDGDYVAKFRPPGMNLQHDYVGMAFVKEGYIRFACPPHYNITWRMGHQELQYVQILDETGAAAAVKQIDREWMCDTLIEFTIAYIKSTNKDIANDAAEYLSDKLKDAGVVHVLSEDESPAAGREEGKLTQSRADLILEANNRDLDGVGSNADDWIDVNDKLPYLDGDSSVYCIVYDVYWGVVVRPYNEAHNCWDGEDGDDYYTDAKGGKITHWKPIPESPFKQQKEK